MLRLLLSAVYVFGTLFMSGFVLMPMVLLLHGLGLRRSAERLTSFIMRTWARYTVLAAGGRVRVSGRENLPDSLNLCVYANHQDYSDIVLLLGWMGLPLGFMGKKELGMVPILSSWMRLSYSVFLDRKSLQQGLRTVHRVASNLRKGRPIVIFPEGTRNFGGPVADFKGGSFKASKLSGSWIVPVTLDGSWRFMGYPGRVKGGPVRIVIHPAIDASRLGAEDWKDLPRRVHDAIEGSIAMTPASEGAPARR